MSAIGALALLLAQGVAITEQPRDPPQDPLVEFTYIDLEDTIADLTPSLEQCGYYLLVRGAIGHSGGFRPGAAVSVRGDTLMILVNNYRASTFDQREWRLARWTLRIGNLGPQVYDVVVRTGDRVLISREVQLSFQVESCAA